MTEIAGTSAKYTGYYRCQDNILHLKIRVRLRTAAGENSSDEEEWHSQEFSWQEKHFSRTQRDFYGEVRNCVTDLEKIYNEKIVNADVAEDSIFFTYVEEEGYTSEHETAASSVSYLQKLVESGSTQTRDTLKHYDFKESVLSSMDNVKLSNNFEKMYIMADFGEYVEDLWIKDERVLCVIKFDKVYKALSVWPDFSSNRPYTLNVQGVTDRTACYFVENCTPEFREELLLLNDSIAKVSSYTKILKNAIIGDTFFLPPKNKLYVYLFVEILSGKRFERPDLYLKYYVDLPENWSCHKVESLKGVTQRCHGSGHEGLMHFGHDFEIVLEYDIQSCDEDEMPKTPYIYFEVISKTIWNCFRREGLTYKNLPISLPGSHTYNLRCYRFDYALTSKIRRFFVGDCDVDEVKWIGLPHEYQNAVLNKFGIKTVGTGELNIRVNVVHQSQAFLKEFNEGDCNGGTVYSKLKASSLIRSVNQVLVAFRKARKNLIEVRESL